MSAKKCTKVDTKFGEFVVYQLYLFIKASNTDFSFFGGAESFSEGRSPRRTVVVTPVQHDDASYFGPPQDPSDFLWLMTEEPHRSRRMAIMKAHPEVTIS